MFRKENNIILEQLKGKEKITMRKKLNSELYIVKQDILKNTLNSVGIYRDFVMKHRYNIIPKTINEKYTIEVDIECNPQRYLRSMIYMCLEIEEVETKLFQFFPMRTDIIPKYCPIDTKSLIEIFIKENKNAYLGNIEDYKESIWNIYFNMNNAIFAQNNYVFDYRISTDGFSVSIQMINKKYVEKESTKKHNMKNKRNEIKEATKNMTPKEKEQYKQKLKDNKKQESDKIKASIKTRKEEQKQAFKKLSQSEKIKIIKRDCPYLEDLTKEQIEQLKTNNWVVCDPGRNTLLYMKSKNGIVFRYSNRKHLKLTKRIKYMRMLKKYKDKNNITKIENELSKYNSKTCIWDNFKQYINAKNRINKLLFEKYENQIFRKYKWYSYLNRKKTETKLIREIKQTYGRKSTIVLGDWSMGKDGCKGSISTPNKGIKKLLTDNFNVYSIDEFRTSKLNYKTEEENDNLYLPDKKGIYREMHSILTFQMENKRMGCINRDNNAVSNMVKLVKYFIKTGKRLLKFRRDYKLKGDDQKDPEHTCLFTHVVSKHKRSDVKHHHARKGTIGALVTIK
jgi:hypothetical protein